MSQSLTSSERQLLALVRASLWQTAVEDKAFSTGSIDWHRIGQLALQQTVGVLAFEAAMSLPENLLPPKEWRQRALTFIEMNRRTQLHVDKCAAEAVTNLNEEGIKSVLLKGQAYACSYPRPEMRQSGDIDLYIGERSYHAAFEAAKRLGWKGEDNFSQKAKHYVSELHGVKIELHRVAAKLPLPLADNAFQEWSQTQITSSNRTINTGGVRIPVPTAIFDIVFVFLHLYNHFLNGGIGMRHIADWVMLLHARINEIDLNELEQKLREFGLMRAWQTFMPIALRYLGLPASECPFYSSKYEKRSEKVLSAIFKEGNFGRARELGTECPAAYLPRKIYTLRLLTVNHLSKISIDPKLVVICLIKNILGGASHTFREISEGKWK